MIERIFSSPTQVLISKSMDAASLRNDIIANNLANADTPRFKRSEVIFEQKLKKVLQNESYHVKLKRTNSKHLQIGEKNLLMETKPEVITLDDLSYRNDENNVDLDVEMAKRTKNEIYYNSLGQSMSHEIKLLRMAITGRG